MFHPSAQAKTTNWCCYFRKHEEFAAKPGICLPSDTPFSATDRLLWPNHSDVLGLATCSLGRFFFLPLEQKRLERERERKSRSLCNSFVMIHPKVMTDTDRLIKGFGGLFFLFVYGGGSILRLAHSKIVILTVIFILCSECLKKVKIERQNRVCCIQAPAFAC